MLSNSSPTSSSPTSSKHSPTTLSYWDLCKAYNLHEDYCAPATTIGNPQRAKCRPFPNCLHGLKAKRGIHATPLPPQLRSLGADPTVRVRQPDKLVGLLNLGATCYLNTLVQVLFMNVHFRHTLYQYRSPPRSSAAASGGSGSGDSDGVVLLLQQLFGLMEYGPQTYESPESIVTELGLRRHVQQDVNEFNNLFLGSLEACLKECAGEGEEVERVKRLVASEFAGESISTVKSQCGHVSQRSSSFLDVCLMIHGKKTLLDCLSAFVEPEPLTAHNAYYCGRCQAKHDAEKQTRFSTLPPVLNLQLIRFHFDKDSGARKKLNDRIFIPYRLSMQPYMTPPIGDSSAAPPTAEQCEYELAGVLRHKGGSVNHGHYTCEVRDARGKWWIFDDDKVGLGGDTFNARGDAAGAQQRTEMDGDGKEREGGNEAGKSKKRKRGKANSLTMKKRKADKDEAESKGQLPITDFMGRTHSSSSRDADGEDDDVVMVDGAGGNESKEEKEQEKEAEDEVLEEKREVEGQRKGIDGDWSSNAYMLVYTLRSRVMEDAKAAEEASQRRANNSSQPEEKHAETNPHVTAAAVSPPSFICNCHTSCRPPPSVRKAIEVSAAKLNDDIRTYETRKKQLMEKIEQRREEVDSLLDGIDAPPINQRTAAEYEQQHTHPNQLSPHKSVRRKVHHRRAVADNGDVIEYDEELEESVGNMDAVAEPFHFIHVGWLQRWLNGQTEREWSDEMAERAVIETRGRGEKKAAVDGGDKGDAIVVDGEEDNGEKEARESPVQSDVIVLDDDDDDSEQRLSSPLDFNSSSFSSSSPSRSSATTASTSSAVQLDTDDPLWPGDIFESCSRLVCPHNKLDPRLHKLRLTKRISSTAWSRLVKENVSTLRNRAQFLVDAGLAHSSEPLRPPVDLGDQSLCEECVAELQAESNQLSAQRGRYEALLEGMKEFTTMTARSQSTFTSGLLSKTGMLLDRGWYKHFTDQMKKWKQKAYSAVPLPSTNAEDVNKGLICTHDNLRSHYSEHAYLISPQLWKCFLDLYPNSTEFPARMSPCFECEEADTLELNKRNELAKQLTREHDKHRVGHLLRRRHDEYPDPKKPPQATKPNQFYYLLPARWMHHKFQPYQDQHTVDSSKPLLDPPPPAPMSELFCVHHKLRYNPVPKGMGGALDGVDKGEVTWCEEGAWQWLVECGHVEGGGELCAKMSITDVVDDDSFAGGWRSVIVELAPPPCEDCILAKQKQEQHRLHQFTKGSLVIRRVSKTVPLGSAHTSEPQASSIASSSSPASSSPASYFAAAAPTSPRSRSRRKRAYTALEEIEVHDVNCTDDVATLRLKISQYCTHIPAHMRLFWRDSEMLENKQLSEYGVTDGGELLMKVDADAAGDGWSTDYMDYLPMDDAVISNDVESGFAGTRLGGGEGKKSAKSATVSPRASTSALLESKEDGGEGRSSSSPPVSNVAVAMDEPKQVLRGATIERHFSNSYNPAAPTLPRISDSVSAPATLSFDNTIASPPATAPTVLSTSVPATFVTVSKSPFLASLAESARKLSATAHLASNQSHFDDTKESAFTHSVEDDEKYAQQLEAELNAERKATTHSPYATPLAEEGRRMQEEADHAFALKLSGQQPSQAVMEEESEGSEAEGDEYKDEEGEDEDDDDGDWGEGDEKKERKRRRGKVSSRPASQLTPVRQRGSVTSSSSNNNNSRGRRRAAAAVARGGNKTSRHALNASDSDGEHEEEGEDLHSEDSKFDEAEDARYAQLLHRRQSQTRVTQLTQVVRSSSQRQARVTSSVPQTAASRPDSQQSPADVREANHRKAVSKLQRATLENDKHLPFVCTACTYHNDSGLVCGMCNNPRAEAIR